MGLVFVADRADPGKALEQLEPLARFDHDGVYAFLQDAVQELHEATGQLIHPRSDAFFIGEDLAELERVLASAFEPAVIQPPEWDQPVGTQHDGGAAYVRTSRADVVGFLRKLAGAARVAREKDAGVLFRGEPA